MKSSLDSLLSQFVALPCWGVVAGKGTGSMVSLDFGDKIPRDRPLSNIHLSEDCRNNSSECSIFIQHSSWLLEQGDKEVCSCDSDNSNAGAMVKGLRRLIGMHVHHVEYIPKQGLYIDFQSDFTLSIFFDALENYGEGFANATLFITGVEASVAGEGVLKIS